MIRVVAFYAIIRTLRRKKYGWMGFFNNANKTARGR